MKSKKLSLLVGLVACHFIGFAQDSSTNPTDATAAVPAAAPAEPPAAEEPAVVPLIQFSDTGLTTAIETLARQAGLNYILDPAVNYGQPGPDGKIVPMPSVSIRWENVTAEHALMALLHNYDLVLAEDPKTKISRVTRREPGAPPPLITKVIQLQYASPSNLLAACQSVLVDKRSRVVPDTRTSQLVVLATEPELVAIDDLVARLDTPTRQVLIEAHLVETTKNPTTIKGIDWTDTLSAQRFTFGNGLSSAETLTTIPGTPTTTTLPGGRTITTQPRSSEETIISTLSGSGGLALNTFKGFTPNIAFLNADGVNAVLSFINRDADAKVLSTPRAVTLDNETANLSVTRAVPIFRNTAGTQGSPGGSEVLYTNLGTILHVTPRISANDNIWLKVIPEVSSVFRTVRKIVAGTINEADEYDIRTIETQVLIPSGNTLVMGGLMSDAANKNFTKVPILGDIPLFGWAFRNESKSENKRNLIIFVTPTIVKDSDFQPAESEFLRNKISREPGKEPTAWESGKPLDWSKPAFYDNWSVMPRDP